MSDANMLLISTAIIIAYLVDNWINLDDISVINPMGLDKMSHRHFTIISCQKNYSAARFAA